MLPRPRHRCLPLLLHAFIAHVLCALVAIPTFCWAGPALVEAFTSQSHSARSSDHLTSRRMSIGLASVEQPVDEVITTARIDPLAVPLVNAFYKANKYKGKAKKSDVVFVAKRSSNDDNTDDIVGAVRLVPKTSDTYFIRNLFVAKECRRKGVGKQLMKAALDGNVGSASWSGARDWNISNGGGNDKAVEEDHHDHSYRYYCFLRRELSPLYHAAGLDVIDCRNENLPDWIREEYLRIRAQQSGKDLILMGKGMLHQVLSKDQGE